VPVARLQCRQWRRAATAKDEAAGGDGSRILKGAEGGAARDDPEGYNGTGCRWWQSEVSVELQVEQRYFSDFDMCSCVWQWQQQHRALQVVQW
jgi:hypothetical protein